MPQSLALLPPRSPAKLSPGQMRQLRRRQIVLFCLFCTLLRRMARYLPWTTLSSAEKRQLDRALAALESDVALARSVTLSADYGQERALSKS